MPVTVETTEYYDEFLRYYGLAKTQQERSNLGSESHSSVDIGDQLMQSVTLYDVVERKYAGFSNIVNDAFYGNSPEHPYFDKFNSGHSNAHRDSMLKSWDTPRDNFDLEDWLYVFILHRVCGSGINYAASVSGYHNTLLLSLGECKNINDIITLVNTHRKSFYTSVGYQFPGFPKPKPEYRRGGDYYLSEYAPRLARELAGYLQKSTSKLGFRDIGGFMLKWNVDNGLRQYHFHYAAVVADIADWFPEYVNRESKFYYGSNAVECISYLGVKPNRVKKIDFLDSVMDKIYKDTGALPYNAEDVCCDFIRWVENYVKPGSAYDGLDFDNVWSSCNILDHPFGRQKNMLKLGLVDTFNGMKNHPADGTIINRNNLTVVEYRNMCKNGAK